MEKGELAFLVDVFRSGRATAQVKFIRMVYNVFEFLPVNLFPENNILIVNSIQNWFWDVNSVTFEFVFSDLNLLGGVASTNFSKLEAMNLKESMNLI